MKFKLLNNLKKISLMLCFAMLFQIASINVVKTHAAENAKLTYSIKGETKIGNIVDILVNISNISNLYGGSVDFLYDKSLLEVQSIKTGSIFGSEKVQTPVEKIENGQANLVFTLTGIKDGVKGNGTIAVIKAKILKAGAINLKTTTKNDDLKVNGNNVRVKLVNSNETAIAYASEEKSISSLGNPVKVTELNVNKSTPQVKGSSITFTAKSSGGSTVLYQFWIFDGNSWKMVRDYNKSNTFTWNPSKSGNYKVAVYAKDINSNKALDSSKAMNYNIVDSIGKVDPVKVTELNVNKSAPQVKGSSITFTAKSSGGSTALYQFWIFDGNGWKMVRDYNRSNTFTWNPSKSGNYKVTVYAKDINSNKALDSSKAMNYNIVDSIGKVDPVKVTELNVNKSAPQVKGSSITFTAKSSGGSTALYQFWIFDGNGWKMVRDYNRSNTFTWNPSKSGNYKVTVYAKDINSNKALDSSKAMNYNIVDSIGKVDPVKVTELNVNKSAPQVKGSSITFTAKSSGGSTALYQFWIFDGNGWKMVRDYNKSNTFTWNPSKSGNYKVTVYAKDINSNKALDSSKAMNYNIVDSIAKVDPVVVNSITSDKSAPQAKGTPIKFTAKASGGSTVLYQFWIFDGSSWKMVRDYDKSNTFTWNSSKNGNYRVSVYAKDINSNKALDSSKVMNYTIN
ncbi:triple tyrosine motif-containing protein [Clostridium septicum]|uniref:PKD/Chitinase domain-containing protein n=1 Tax=Clostridium septicum TaxID=1504 RepID=A0A9N7JK81_CLOSE|nr:triple tyrosine motif-containing protein [Clostridium septicum]AYE33880.1 hypothetical protein CP523_05010 [Clostridium septicum]UEC21512.1 hypothetical protein LK444_03830 [Clostridium septicum]USS00441.1 hypothetical protein NH397_13255 [Clostridium septicum]